MTVALPKWNWDTRLCFNEIAEHWLRIKTIDKRMGDLESVWWGNLQYEQLREIATNAWDMGHIYNYVLAMSYMQQREGDRAARGWS